MGMPPPGPPKVEGVGPTPWGTIVEPEVRHEIRPGLWIVWDAKVIPNERGLQLRAKLKAAADEIFDRLETELDTGVSREGGR